MRSLLKDIILSCLIIAVFGFAATDALWAASYGCFKDSTASVDVPGNAGICVTTPQGMLCSLDMTDCIIPSVGIGCPNLPNISYDATTNQCVVPPICQNGVYDTSYHQCVVTSKGTCPAGSTQAASGLCSAAPSCSVGTYSAAYNQCIVTSAPNCPSGSSLDGVVGLCAGPLACQMGTSYSSTSNMCIDAAGAIISSPICSAGLTLNTITNRCESVPLCSGAGVYEAASKLCVDTSPQTTCFTSSSVLLNSNTGMCEAYPACPSGTGQQFDPQAGVCISLVPATCPPDGFMNTATDRCEAPQGCTSGSLTPTGSLCLDSGPAIKAPICPAGTTMNATTNMCDAAPACPAGKKYDLTVNACVATVKYAAAYCPPGSTLNLPTGVCQANMIACSSYGAVFDPVQHLCVYPPINLCPIVTLGGFNYCIDDFGTYYKCPGGPGTPMGTFVPAGTVQSTWLNYANLCTVGTPIDYCPPCSDCSRCNTNVYYGGPAKCPGGVQGATSDGYDAQCVVYADPNGCPAYYNFDSSSGTCTRPSFTPKCSSGLTFDPSSNLCEVSATCPSGFVYYNYATDISNACTDTSTATPTCPDSTTLNSNTGRCDVAPACPVNFVFDPSTHLCQSTVRTCPLGSQYTCQDYNGKKMCSAIGCVDLSTAPVTTVPDPPTASQTNNGAIDPNSGQCMGQLVIFPGKPEYCRPPGLATVGTNCCSAAHGGKFSRTEDLDQAIQATVNAYYQNIDTYINCDSNTVKIDQHPSGYKAGSDTINQYPVVAGTPITYYQEIDPQSGPYPRFDYSTVTSGGLTTIQTVIDYKSANWTTTGCGSPPTLSYARVYPRELIVNQTYGNYKNDVYVAINDIKSTLTPTCGTTCGPGGQYPDVAYDPYTDLTYDESPLVTMDSSTGVCTVSGNFKDARCQFVCKTSMSGGNIQMTADYILTDPPYSLVENVAIVAKGPTGTSVSLKMPNDYDCEGFINSGQAVMVIFSNEIPALTASTTVNQQGAYSNQTILHTGFLPDVSAGQAFQQLFGVVTGAINWYTSPCRPHERQTDIDRDANKCHTIGSYCISKIWGNCTQRKTSYCCFNSKLGRIIQEQGRPQLQEFGPDGGWGIPEQPNCIGLSPEQFQMLDFSKMDLSEFIADIVQPVASDIAGKISDRLQNYYNNTQSQATGTTQ